MFQRGRQDERLRLKRVIELWNASRLDLFEITEPDEVCLASNHCWLARLGGYNLQTNFFSRARISRMILFTKRFQ